MGYGYIALAYFLMMFPVTFSNEFFSTSNLSLIGFAFLFMGLYQAQQRIHNRHLQIASAGSILFFIALCFLDTKYAVFFSSIVEPIVFLNILYGVKKECNIKTQKQIRHFTILYLIMFFMLYLYLTHIVANTEFIQAMMVILIFLRICMNIYFLLLILSINRQLKAIEPLPVHEKPITYNKKHTMVMLAVILFSAGILYGTQGLYLTSMQVSPVSDYQNRIYEGTQTDSRIAGQMTISINQNVSDIYSYGQVNLYTKDESIVKQAKFMKYHLYIDGKAVKKKSNDLRFMKTDVVKVEKQSNGEYRIAFDSSHDLMDDFDGTSQVSMHVELYDEEENVILKETYPIHERNEHVYHGSAHGITIRDLYAGNTTILQAPIIQTNILQMAQTRGYTSITMFIEYLQDNKVVAESNSILLDDIPWAPYVHQHMDVPKTITTSWDDTIMAYEQMIPYDQVILIMKYQGEGKAERTFVIPLQENKP